MKRRFTLIFLLYAQAFGIGEDPAPAPTPDSAILTGIIQDNKDLDPMDPRELGMKVRSLLRDEYTFFRGSAANFYRLSVSIAKDWMADEANWVLLHGDIHIGNTGTYQGPGKAGEDIRFGVVDLDETIQGPFQFDLLRAMTAVRFAAGIGKADWDETKASQALCDGYSRTLSGAKSYRDIITQSPAAQSILHKAAKNEARKYAARYVELEPSPRFRSTRIKDGAVRDILEPLTDAERDSVAGAMWSYLEGGCAPVTRERFRFKNVQELREGTLDVARWTRVESSGSQGVFKYLVLLDNPLKDDNAPLILELKEQPAPAAAAIGLLPSANGARRAEEVAAAYQQLIDPPPRLIGFTRMGDRGFLVRTKDPWNEDLEAADFGIGQRGESAVEAATLLGEVLGLAHRNGLLRSNGAQKIPLVLDQVSSLPPLLRDRSKVIGERLRKDFQILRDDPKAQELAKRAEAYIEKSSLPR